MSWENALECAVDAAQAAGALLRAPSETQHVVLQRGAHDVKLQADRDAEALILDTLGSAGYAVLAEESGEHGSIGGDAPYWVVDPLDGTVNFSRRIPLCCISIALCVGGEPKLGVVHDFHRGELFTGIPGEGAWLNGARIEVASTERSADAILCTGFPNGQPFEEGPMLAYLRRAHPFKKVRMFGSAALMMAYVACGRVDAYVEEGNYFWDIAAGAALVRAAGGHVEIAPAAAGGWARRVRCACRASIWEGAF